MRVDVHHREHILTTPEVLEKLRATIPASTPKRWEEAIIGYRIFVGECPCGLDTHDW